MRHPNTWKFMEQIISMIHIPFGSSRHPMLNLIVAVYNIELHSGHKSTMDPSFILWIKIHTNITFKASCNFYTMNELFIVFPIGYRGIQTLAPFFKQIISINSFWSSRHLLMYKNSYQYHILGIEASCSLATFTGQIISINSFRVGSLRHHNSIKI